MIVHFVDNPRGGKHLGFLAGAGELFLRRFLHAGLDFDFHKPQQLVLGDLRGLGKFRAVLQVGVCSEDDILFCGLVLEQPFQHGFDGVVLKVNQLIQTGPNFRQSISVVSPAASCVSSDTSCFQEISCSAGQNMNSPGCSRYLYYITFTAYFKEYIPFSCCFSQKSSTFCLIVSITNRRILIVSITDKIPPAQRQIS